MIIEDNMGTVLLDSRVASLIIDQNGNRWKLTDEIDGLALELVSTAAYAGIAAVPLAFRTIMIKPDNLPQSVVGRNGKAEVARR